jgi:3-dehydroquinate dehydratase-1
MRYSMICVSLAEESAAECLEALKGIDCAEIRIDKMRLTLADIPALFSLSKTLIATCRPGLYLDKYRKDFLLKAIESGAAFVDIELESEITYREEITAKARSCGCGVIVSFHDHAKTPARHELEGIVDACFRAGADIAKIACMVHSSRDNARLLGLLDDSKKIVVIGMGDKGRITRIAASLLGSPFTFASLSKGKETAPGQIDKEKLEALLRNIAESQIKVEAGESVMAKGEGRRAKNIN